MKVARLYDFTTIRIEDVPVPAIGPRDTLLRTKACGICSGDVMPWYIEKKAPLVLGHEPVGEIIEVGAELAAEHPWVAPGQRVFIHHHAPCMKCRHCLRGDHVQCETWRLSKIVPGGIAEYILVPEGNLLHDTLPLPDGVGYEDGTMVEPTACVVKSLSRSRIVSGDTLLVIGLGVMGLIHILLARHFGAGTVIGADFVPFRLGKALEFGADHTIDVSKENLVNRLREITGGLMAQVVIVGPNSVEVMREGLRAVGRGGTVVFFTPAKPGEVLTLDPNDLYFRDVSLVTSYSCGPDDTREALRYIAGGVVSAAKLVTHRFSIGGTGEAFRLTAEARDSLKSLIVFP
jgi:L-iditol 2-dehydrogenase